ncbi:MAG: formylglycine-generating enzyme family protein [Nitrospirota bacterium]|nr:formylglycine-generating enzyme family protein [Nitrospirota bacterium]MDH5698393.1 formylglycine-generating enzyme family protein [Nitrospirota bacterium]
MPFAPAFFPYYPLFTPFWAIWLILGLPGFAIGDNDPLPPEVDEHITRIAGFAKSSPKIAIPEGLFLMGTNRRDDLRHGFEMHYDDTEFPQRRIWVDEFSIDKYEASLGEYLAFLLDTNRPVSRELRGLILHLISVHFIPDQALAPWPALYVTWEEAKAFCEYHHKRLPSEAEWEKAARGESARIFPWGEMDPTADLAVFGQYHVHEIPLVATVDSFEDGQSIYKVFHLAGNIAEWVNDWLGPDYYPIMPEKNPPGPKMGRYKVVRGGSWKSRPVMLRAATRGGAFPEERSANIGFRCVQTSP